MDLSPYATQLSTEVPALTVEIATQQITALATDTAAGLYSVLSPLVSGRVYPLHVEPDTIWPNITYQLVESEAQTADGYHIATVDRFVVWISATDPEWNAEEAAEFVRSLGAHGVELVEARKIRGQTHA